MITNAICSYTYFARRLLFRSPVPDVTKSPRRGLSTPVFGQGKLGYGTVTSVVGGAEKGQCGGREVPDEHRDGLKRARRVHRVVEVLPSVL